MREASKPQGKAMYVAPKPDWDWLLTEQTKLHARSWKQSDYVFRKLWGLVTDPRNLRMAFARVARNRGHRTAGVDGVTVRSVLKTWGAERFVDELRAELRSGSHRPSPVRRIRIPKKGKPGEFRPLGIPTVKDRVVQAALKAILEPIFEAGFYPCSYGFRPRLGVHIALEQTRKLLAPKKVRRGKEVVYRLPYQWAIEGDIKGCFDHIDHHGLMERVRLRVSDRKVNRLIVAFLKSGILSEGTFLRSESGTPQGGILSPLLANIALSVLDERYERTAWPRKQLESNATPPEIKRRAAINRRMDKAKGKAVLVPVRYADDFLIFVGVDHGPEQAARAEDAANREKAEVARLLKETLNLQLSEAKTLVTPVTQPMPFLGHNVRVAHHPKYGWSSKTVIPKKRSHMLRERIKKHFRQATTNRSLGELLAELNPVLRGWGYFYRHAWGAKQVFDYMDHYVWWCIKRWLIKKYGRRMGRIYKRHGWRKPGGRTIRWRDGNITPFPLVSLKVERYRHAWFSAPAFTEAIYGEPGADRKSHAGFGRGGPGNRRT